MLENLLTKKIISNKIYTETLALIKPPREEEKFTKDKSNNIENKIILGFLNCCCYFLMEWVKDFNFFLKKKK